MHSQIPLPSATEKLKSALNFFNTTTKRLGLKPPPHLSIDMEAEGKNALLPLVEVEEQSISLPDAVVKEATPSVLQGMLSSAIARLLKSTAGLLSSDYADDVRIATIVAGAHQPVIDLVHWQWDHRHALIGPCSPLDLLPDFLYIKIASGRMKRSILHDLAQSMPELMPLAAPTWTDKWSNSALYGALKGPLTEWAIRDRFYEDYGRPTTMVKHIRRVAPNDLTPILGLVDTYNEATHRSGHLR